MRIYGKKGALASIHSFSASGRFPHALLLTGESGVGKRTLADYAAMLCMCEKHGVTPCMSCNECRRIEAHIHPDAVYPLEQMGGKYSIKPLREFITSCSRKPNDGDIRICIFENLDEMSVQCQNGLLTFIEEPLPFNRFIFTAKKKSAVLTTILSRVISIECSPADRSDFMSAMAEKEVPEETAEELFTMYGGNIGAALNAFEHPEENELVNKTARIADFICSGREFDCAIEFSSLKTREDIFSVLGQLSDIFAAAAAKKSGLKADNAFKAQIDRLSTSHRLPTLCSLYDESCRLYGKSVTNPNTQLLAAECSASLFNAMEKMM